MGTRSGMRVPARRVRRWRAVVLMAAAVMLAAACGPTTPVPTPGPPLASAAPSSGAARPAASASAPTPRASGPPSSSSLIAAAEAAGTLDHDTALLYQLYSALDYASLPAAYQSDSPAAPDATRILAELRIRSAQLSPDLRARVAPFFLRPSDPGSVWARRTRTGSRPESVALAAYTANDCPDNPPMSHCVDAASTPVRIWYSAYESLDETAAALAREIDRSAMWAKERTAMVGHIPCTDAVNSPGGTTAAMAGSTSTSCPRRPAPAASTSAADATAG